MLRFQLSEFTWMVQSQSQSRGSVRERLGPALAGIPSGLFVLTAAFEDRRLGMLTEFVQQVGFEPPMVCVAVAKGRAIMPLISESRQFALCQLAGDEKVISRKFRGGQAMEEDPFLGFELIENKLPNLPILAHTIAHLECELSCHMDVEGDHDLFVGTVHEGGRRGGDPCIRLREDGFNY